MAKPNTPPLLASQALRRAVVVHVLRIYGRYVCRHKVLTADFLVVSPLASKLFFRKPEVSLSQEPVM